MNDFRVRQVHYLVGRHITALTGEPSVEVKEGDLLSSRGPVETERDFLVAGIELIPGNSPESVTLLVAGNVTEDVAIGETLRISTSPSPAN